MIEIHWCWLVVGGWLSCIFGILFACWHDATEIAYIKENRNFYREYVAEWKRKYEDLKESIQSYFNEREDCILELDEKEQEIKQQIYGS